ncbi:hypothetical protein E2C01_087037 [Portunus trituberculatus]|uniref:Uncharacterized protein n=1 Tax=Portunus trituberculatus TaxID=210409 RepID=A0A5B7J5G1_PORTR|nr:hypothetical protein [Portunus trituberculatus]
MSGVHELACEQVGVCGRVDNITTSTSYPREGRRLGEGRERAGSSRAGGRAGGKPEGTLGL